MTATGDALSREAALLYRSGRFDAAREAYGRLLERDPRRPNDWLNYGLLLRMKGDFHAALSAYDAALQNGAARAEEIHLNRAVILVDDLAKPDEALDALKAALDIRPDYVPALLNLGNIHEDAGDRDAARQAYGRALELEPDNPMALMRLADVTRFEGPDDPLIARLRKAVGRTDHAALERADLGYALGRALDQCENYDEAFAAYRLANKGSRALAPHPYDPAGAERFIDALIAGFPSRGSEASESDPSPIFICGMFRSGSTLVERILSAHSQITAGGELPFLPNMVRERLQPYPQSLAGRGEALYAELRKLYLDGLARTGLSGQRLTDKRPDNFLHVGLIKRLFPDAKIVLTRRNPLDNCLSVYFAHLDPALTYASSLESAVHWYRQHERLASHWQALFPDDVHCADYDALVADPGSEVARLLEFLGLDWEDACLKPHSGSGHVRTASAWQVREPLYTRSSGRWRNYRAHLDALLDVFGESENLGPPARKG
ncbi:sulfotransferase [Qipengyuania sp. YG27]|uniref:Sulfotransferase n=1 Tax=Qipengyuania mesophila TaxID=2867246 RepID=A0ABS7JYG3_9SPHN|nr:sulfotransferase [Qipengyuania mesophila]MBX7502697.1 sulfotransferase [Qipengyuania mesophila]